MPSQFTRAKGFAGGYEEPKLEILNWNSNNFFNENWTYEAWIKLTGMPTSENIDFLNFSNHVRLCVRDADSVTKLRFFTLDGFEVMASTGSRWTNSTWHHVAFVKDGSTIKMYCDGAQIYTGTHTFNVAVSTSALYFGARNFPDGSLLTEIRLWNTARTGSEILNNYKIEVPSNSSGLTALYRFTDIPIPVDYSVPIWVTVPNLGAAGSSMNTRFSTYPFWTSNIAGIYEVNDHPWQEAPSNSNILVPSSQSTGTRTQLNITLTSSSLETASNTAKANWAKVLAIYTSPNKKPSVVTFRPNASVLGRFRASSAFSASYSLTKIVIIHADKSQTILDRSVLTNPSSMDVSTT